MSKGYVKDFRKELNSDIWLMPPLYHRVWQYLKYSVNHEPNQIPMRDGNTCKVIPGQHLTSLRLIAKGIGWYEGLKWREPNPKTIKVILDWMIKQSMIQVNSGQGNRQYTLITLVNWELYQSKEHKGNVKVTQKKQFVDINKNDKNEKNIKDYSPEFKKFRQRYSDLINLIDTYFDILRTTRVSGKISDSIIHQVYTEMKKYPVVVVKSACITVISNPNLHSKRENYFYGIMRNTPADEAAEKIRKYEAARTEEAKPNEEYLKVKASLNNGSTGI